MEITRISAKALIYNTHTKSFLLVKSFLHKHRDVYGLPGGGLKKGEQVVAGLCRELKEELSLDLGVYKHSLRYLGVHTYTKKIFFITFTQKMYFFIVGIT